ncbi:ribonuclease P protein component [Thiohalocapsa marina]|uniref:ribonuclease P protein component n=1 Tax=Thiohalocapsa marina TaxID=424902 RepID=UPI001FEA49E6|nr:ribonuclease P protein component [Thiohalocapsa marina]
MTQVATEDATGDPNNDPAGNSVSDLFDPKANVPVKRPQPTQARCADRGFPRRRRLLRPGDYQAVFADPARSSDRLFTVLASRTSVDTACSRLGLAISKKCAPRAVDRNRIKRLIRESFRQGAVATCALDLVVLARPQARTADNRSIANSLQRHWSRLQQRLCAPSSD